jgi:hypothetical protein
MDTLSFHHEGDAEHHLMQSIRRQLLVRYFSGVFAAHEITDQALAEAFADGDAFRAWVMQQGITPDTLRAFTAKGRVLIRTCANIWVQDTNAPPRDSAC